MIANATSLLIQSFTVDILKDCNNGAPGIYLAPIQLPGGCYVINATFIITQPITVAANNVYIAVQDSSGNNQVNFVNPLIIPAPILVTNNTSAPTPNSGAWPKDGLVYFFINDQGGGPLLSGKLQIVVYYTISQ